MPRYAPRSMSRLMFIEFSRRRSPSTAVLASAERIAFTSTSVRSFTLVVGAMPVFAQMSLARERPTPKMCVSPMTTCLFIGMFTPAIRAMFDTYLLTLALLVARVRANDIDDAATAHDLAVLADFLDRGTNFHLESPLLTLRRATAAITHQVRLLEQTRVVMRHQVSLKLREEVHGHHDDDEQRGATEHERHAATRHENLGEQAHRGDVDRAPERQAREHLVDVFAGLLTGADAANERARLLEVVSRFTRVEHQRRVEEAEEDDEHG